MRAQFEKKERIPTWAMMVAALAMAMNFGCERPDWENPDYVAQMLAEGDSAQKREAVGALRNFPEDRRDEIAGSLTKIYLEDDELRDEVMRSLMQWRLPGAVEAYTHEMKTDETGSAEHAGEVLGRIQSRESIPAMLDAFAATGNDERRDGILRGIALMPDPSMADVALEVLGLDVDNHKISMHSHTCNLVGDLALEHPDAISDELKLALIRSVFLSDKVGRQIYRECRLAIQKVGLPMTPHLIELFNQENEEIERLMMTYEQSTPEGYQYPFNRAKQEASLLLTALRAPEAVDLFLEDMAIEKEVPEGYSQGRKISWIRMEGASLNEMILGLGDLGDPKARPMLERVVAGALINEEWTNITDDMVDFQFRQDAARSLTRLGDRDARAKLMEMAQADIIGVMARRFAQEAARLEENPDAQVTPQTEQFRTQWQAAGAFAYLAEADDRGRYEAFVAGVDEGEYKEKLESFLPAFDVMDECGEEEAEAIAACYGKFLDSDEEAARFKAAYELSRLDEGAGASVIAENISTDRLSTREVLTFAGYRAPSAELATNIEAVMEAEKSRSASEYERDRRRLKMLHAWLQHHDSDPVVAAE